MAASGPNWAGLYSAIGDTLWEFGSGKLVTRTTAQAVVGDTSLSVESTDRFPDAGLFAAGGALYGYGGKTLTAFTGIRQWVGPEVAGPAGLKAGLRPNSPVLDESQDTTQLDLLRATFFLLRAEGIDLDVFGANYGINRPPGIDDDTWQELLILMIALPTQVMHALRGVLDILHPGAYQIWENPVSRADRFKVFVQLTEPLDGTLRGKGFLAGSIARTRASASTINASIAPTLVYGIYDATDPLREGTNFCFFTDTGSADLVGPDILQDLTNTPFAGTTLDQPVMLTMPSGDVQLWVVTEVISTSRARVAWRPQGDGQVSSADLTRFRTDGSWFTPWVGRGGPEAVELVITSGINAGAYPVAAYIDPYEIQISGSLVGVQADATWFLRPAWSDTTGIPEHSVFTATSSGTLITVTGPALPVDCLVDSVHMRSGELLANARVDGTNAAPLYLFQFGASTKTLLDDITASGVTIVLEVNDV